MLSAARNPLSFPARFALVGAALGCLLLALALPTRAAVTSTADSGAGTLRQGVSDVANGVASATTLQFDATFDTPQTITLSSSFASLGASAGSLTLAPQTLLTVDSGANTFLDLAGTNVVYNVADLRSISTSAAAITVRNGAVLNAGSTFAFDHITLDSGTFQTSADYTATGDIVAGTNGGTFNITAGTATFSGNVTASTSLVKSGVGTLALTGAANQITSYFVVGGTVHQTSGSSVSAYEMGIGSGTGTTGIYTIDGGTLTTLAGTPPAYVGGTASSLRIGDFGGTGTLNQTGGVVTTNGALNVGNQGGHGTYNLSGGELHVASGFATLGRTSGGSTSSGGSTGALNLSGTGLLSVENSSDLVLSNWYPYSGSGAEGVGVLTQTGGTLAVANSATLILTGLGSGTYNLDGGTLQIGGSSLVDVFYGEQGGSYQFNLGGGTIQVSGSTLTTAANATLVSGTTSTIDTNGLGATFSGSLTGSGNLLKTGAGTLTLAGGSTYSGSTTIGSGTIVASHASALGSGAVSVSGAGTVLQVQGVSLNNAITLASGGKLFGTGSVGALTLNSGGILSMGSAPGMLSSGTAIFNGGGVYAWHVNDTLGARGVNWDLLSVNGTLTIASDSSDKFTLCLESLTSGNVAGQIADFNVDTNYSYIVATTTGGVIGFNANSFTIDATGFRNAYSGTWSMAVSGDDLLLNYTAPTGSPAYSPAVPEPSTYAAIAGLSALLLAGWRARKRAGRMKESCASGF